MICEDCTRFPGCLERRGICRDYKGGRLKDMERIRREIESVNEKFKTARSQEADSHSQGRSLQRTGSGDPRSQDPAKEDRGDSAEQKGAGKGKRRKKRRGRKKARDR